jgi:4-amino-4-deoxychorismate lyase
MSPLLETIKCFDGKLYNLQWHNSRFNRSRELYFGINSPQDLSEIIETPKLEKKGLFRCRVTYSKEIESIKFLPHIYRKIERLKLVEDNSINYRFKFADRSRLQKLYEKRGDCDDILIIKNGYITDSFTANPVFYDGQKWWTPDTPLLPGTQRERLIYEKKIFECRITPSDITKYEKIGLINALQDLSNMPIVAIKHIQS